MPIVEICQLKASLTGEGRLMGLDPGSKIIGVALSDVFRSVASPHTSLKRTKFQADADRLLDIIDGQEVIGMVIGLPVEMDGTEGPRCQSTRQFARNLLSRRDVPIAFWDERLSTTAVERVLIGDADMTRKRRAEVVDKMAAAYILQGALDALSA